MESPDSLPPDPDSKRDAQTTLPGGKRAGPPQIQGVAVSELGNVISRSGYMVEIFRDDWPLADFSIRQINWAELNPGAATDWHYHALQTDHLIGVDGSIKLALIDGRKNSDSYGARDVVRIGALRPVVVTIPPGVWHALRNESGRPAGYLNLADQPYDYETPDDFRVSPDDPEVRGVL
jgi:dTDP-4-dehydrorhamnose 3,5-epimerase